MIDVKKLITGFLILAAAGGASALIISYIGNSSALANTAIISNVVATSTDASGQAVSGNAFLSDTDSDQTFAAIFTDDNPSTDTASNDPNNLTDALAGDYLTQLIATNPSGPGEDDNGNPTVTSPDSTSVIDQFLTTSTITNINAPDWDAEADQVPIHVISNPSSSTLANYSASVQNIFNQDFVQTNLESMLDGNTDPSAATYAEPQIQSALQDIAGLQTPASAVAFQKSLIKLLIYEKNTLALITNDSDDPVKTALVLQDETPKYNEALQNFQTESQAVSLLPGFSPLAQAQPTTQAQGPVMAFINNALGIQTAHAFLGLGDIDFDPTTFGQMLISYAENIALQIAKNFITHKMQATVLGWVQGSGAPKFIQQWGTTMVKAYTNAAVNVLNNQFACINPALAPQVKAWLTTPTPNVAGSNSCASQFPALLAGSNLQKFSNNFQSGGFATYVALFQPGGNQFSIAMDTQDQAMSAGAASQQVAQTKAVGNQGWKSDAICDDGQDPDTGCHANDALNPTTQMCIPHGGGAPYAPKEGDGDGDCADGEEPQDIQPGQVVGQVFNSAVDSGGNLTAAANDLAGLLDAFLTSLLNSIATEAVSAGSGLLNNLGTSSAGAGTPGGATGAQTPIACTGILTSENPDNVQFIGSGGQVTALNSGASATINTTQPTYSWSVPGGTPSIGTGGSFASIFNASGTYAATITDTNPADGGVTGVCTISVP